jgi:ATP-dependent Lhr-like helicase
VPTRTGPPTVTGRWSLLPDRDPDLTRRSHAIAQALLDRHGIVTRGSVVAERVPGGFGALYPVLRAMEEAGQCRRGYFVEGLGAAQFALPGAVDRMRAVASAQEAAAAGPPGDSGHPHWPGQPSPAGPPQRAAPRPPGAARLEEAARPGGAARPEGISWPEGAVWADEEAGANGSATGGAAGPAAAWGDGGRGAAAGGTAAWAGGGGGAAAGDTAAWAGGSGGTAAGGTAAWGGGDARIASGTAGPGTSGGTGTAETGPPITVLAAADPANAFGAALPWPARPGEVPGAHRPGRKAGALVVLSDGKLVLYVERGGKTLLSWTSDPEILVPAAAGLAEAVRGGALGRLTVERADGTGVYDTPLAQALADAGFRPTPRGLRLRG